MITYNPTLKKRSKNEKYGIINIRVTKNRKHTYHTLSIRLNESDWNKNRNEVRKSHPDHILLNSKIDDKISDLKKLLSQSDISHTYKEGSFLEYLDNHINDLVSAKKIGNSKKYITTYKHLRSYQDEVLFSDITIKFLNKFKNFLRTKSIGDNTIHNYFKCIQKLFRQALNEKVYVTLDDPFKNYSLANDKKIEKEYLNTYNLRCLVDEDINDPKLYEIRNRFLFQIYGQGLRVSDLLTLRYSNINFVRVLSRIDFIQYKTRTPNSIQLSPELTRCIFYYVDRKRYMEMYYKDKYEVKSITDDEAVTDTYQNLIRYAQNKVDQDLDVSFYDTFTGKITLLKKKLARIQYELILKYSIDHNNDFIIPVLPNDLFKDVEFHKNTRLNRKQVNKISSMTAVYNKQLKKLAPITGNPNIRLSSHIARHSYSNLMLETGADIYTISKSLGHSNLSVTESYVSSFSKEKIDADNSEAFRSLGMLSNSE
ncbi:site-specific integrase [Aureitalea sp. L0-47]|uniref:site-specific integrase n=1 Tax=Aureitalea sp. L0-47 TaxID=2816962 RepID=UPI00223827BE|nr:site-specific integrase [Aureitalea sp. L0-47]MCW5520194.1 site-specific integrase [Aureitalea sp. L0-47]